MPYDLTLITAILSMSAVGRMLARIALQLGAGVPVISLGLEQASATDWAYYASRSRGERFMHLMVPAHDSRWITAFVNLRRDTWIVWRWFYLPDAHPGPDWQIT
jgi:hypothetical protein